MKKNGLPPTQGLYDPRFEHDACGVGFVCQVKGAASHAIVRQGIDILKRLSHRGATGADPETGDGAGILIQIPHAFFAGAAAAAGVDLPAKGAYGTGLVFLPCDRTARDRCKAIVAQAVADAGQRLLGWRTVPVDPSAIGKTARESAPVIEQPFIARSDGSHDAIAFERILYVIRKKAENTVRGTDMLSAGSFYITNLSSRTFSYKGLLTPEQVDRFFIDLRDPSLASALALVHSRYSTNTFPTWDLAQPFRFLAHNGEINTIRGNINWMKAREALLQSTAFGSEIRSLIPVTVPGGSDSAALDNIFELLTLAGRPLPHAMMMLMPAAWEHDTLIDDRLKAFYEYHAACMEPWDGPAAVAFTDGTRIGACLDRNGLRPARYLVTKNDAVIMASEMGVLEIPPSDILRSGRLEPGKIFYIDTELGRIVNDHEVKETVAGTATYEDWIEKKLVYFDSVPAATETPATAIDIALFKAFGYTREDMRLIIKPMAQDGQEPVGSMGNDAPHAVLSTRAHLLYTYFKQLFAQVTNPPIDPIREEIVMSLDAYLGPDQNLLTATADHCHKVKVTRPVLTDEELARFKTIAINGFRSAVVPTTFDTGNGEKAALANFMTALDRIADDTSRAIDTGHTFIILSDRGVGPGKAAVPALLATGLVHHHLIRTGRRTRVGIIVESAEPREVHHFALHFGYGADCINPYLAYEAVRRLAREGDVTRDERTAVAKYLSAVNKGILKILSKMGISTLRSYKGAQIFEALGVGEKVIERCFTGTVSRIGGIGFDTICHECMTRHRDAYADTAAEAPNLASGGLYQWRRDGEHHLWNPDTIATLQDATRSGNYATYKEFARRINDQSANPTTIRSLLKWAPAAPGREPLPLSRVEPAHEILRRFATGAMSFGSISRMAHETLAIAMNRLGGRSNTGEGGEDPARFKILANGDSARSAIKQVASGRFGVTTNYLINADEIQIKIAQGAKPGEGGQLPGHKVSAIIARTRYTTEGVTLISPPPHHDIYSIEDLAQLIFDLKNTNPRARISVKLVSEIGVGTIAAGVAKGHADMILISGGDGGTGASPLSSIKHAGLPWELGLAETHQTLVLNNLRSRVRLQTDGQMRTGRDVAIAACLGAEEFGFCTAALIVSGCVMLRHCHLNNCSVGVATQDPHLEKHFRGTTAYLVNYFTFVVEELREIMASLGIAKLDDLVGRTDLLETDTAILPPKGKDISLERILYRPTVATANETRCTMAQDHRIDDVLDRTLIRKARPALERREPTVIDLPITNMNRTTGAMLSGEICRRHGEAGLPDGTLRCRFRGVAGQSFGAFLARGVTLELEGMANDYVGKGISGGRIIIHPDRTSTYQPEENVIIGNTAFYGAISGEAYIRGVAGERFCIRNSGLTAVVEGVGDHGCEYMTGGRVVILGKTGRNFGAGMSGGIAYLYNPGKDFARKCNWEMVEAEPLEADDMEIIARLLANHYQCTRSPVARQILQNFAPRLGKFVKIMPIEYKRVLKHIRNGSQSELVEVSDG